MTARLISYGGYDPKRQLTPGCPHCQNPRRLFARRIVENIALAGEAAIIPAWVRCDWCRRVIDTSDLRDEFFMHRVAAG
jgi:hypothetical protein